MKKHCPSCSSNKVKRFGKTSANKQRFRCLACGKTFVWQRTYNKAYKEQHWFKLWIIEGYSARQLAKLSGHSIAKIYRIIYHWLKQKPPALSQHTYRRAKYLLFDGTYFHKDGCLIVLMDVVRRGLIDYTYIERENYDDVHSRMTDLKEQGLSPSVVTLDGHKPVTQAFLNVWPEIITQRCLFHIENQGLMWIRSFPKTIAGKELRTLLKGLTRISSQQDQDVFQRAYSLWRESHKEAIKLLPKESVANKDLQRTMRLIDNALPNMFWFIKDPSIAKTTNFLENFYSQLKHHYQRHRGLTTEHKIGYLSWYCYFKSLKSSNTS